MRSAALALACAVFAFGCGKSNPSSPSSSPGGTLLTVQINNSVYAPNPLMMRVGQQVNWKNNDPITHTATIDGMFNNVISPNSAQGAPVTMNTQGTFTYRCTIHPGMTGTIVVQP